MTSRSARATSRPDDNSYIEFLKDLKLVGLGLKSSSATLDRSAFFEVTEREGKANRRLSESYVTSKIGNGYFEAEGRYEVKIADEDSVGLHVQCVFQVHMHAADPIEKNMADRFAATDLRFILLPYAREFVTTITSHMQIPPVILPLATAAGKARPPKRLKTEGSTQSRVRR